MVTYPERVLRTLFTPRWLLLLGLVVGICIGFVWLGLWQLSVAQHDAIEELRAERAALVEKPLEEVLSPHQAFPSDGSGHPVVVTGSYDASRQFLVPNRVLEGEPGYWVVTPLVVEQEAGVIPVLRGFVPDPASADTPPAQQVTVRGELAPGESPYLEEEPLPTGQRGSIDLSLLANQWPEDLFNAFIFATAEDPPLTSEALSPVPPPELTAGEVDWRNLGYALQWWVFAAFAVFMYLKLLHDAARQRAGGSAEGLRADADPGDDAPKLDGAAPADERIEPHHV